MTPDESLELLFECVDLRFQVLPSGFQGAIRSGRLDHLAGERGVRVLRSNLLLNELLSGAENHPDLLHEDRLGLPELELIGVTGAVFGNLQAIERIILGLPIGEGFPDFAGVEESELISEFVELIAEHFAIDSGILDADHRLIRAQTLRLEPLVQGEDSLASVGEGAGRHLALLGRRIQRGSEAVGCGIDTYKNLGHVPYEDSRMVPWVSELAPLET